MADEVRENDAVAITGLGVVAPLAASHEELARRFAAGERVNGSPALDRCGSLAEHIPLDVVPENTRGHVGRLDRYCQLLLAASHLAVGSARLEAATYEPTRTGLVFGTGLGCLLTNEEYFRRVIEGGVRAASPRLFAYTVSSTAAGEVSIALGIKGPNVTRHEGLAAGVGALGYGFDLLQTGKADAVLAGGGDVNGPALVAALAEMKLLKDLDRSRPFHDETPGVYPAEGAVVAVLERAADARRRGARALATITGYASGFEPTLTRAAPSTEGLVATVRRALAPARRDADEVDLVLASAHGTRVDETERAALAEALGRGSNAMLLASKSSFGESFGAAGLLDVALAAGLWQAQPRLVDGVAHDLGGAVLPGDEAQRRIERARVALVHSLCTSGNVVALVLERGSENPNT
jgi:3-oxoacyl-[acyl-carrier-protein] synthase II